MPCPVAALIVGTSSVTVSAYNSRAAAEAAAGQAARGAAISKIVDMGFCPEDCKFPAPHTIVYTTTSVESSWMSFLNIVGFGWVERVFGKGWFYDGTAHFSWTAQAACAKTYPTYLVPGDPSP